MQILKKITGFFLSLILFLSLITGFVWADESTILEQPVVEEEYVEVEEEVVADSIISSDNDELLEEYIEVQLSTNNKPMYSVNGAGKQLTGTNRITYNILKEKAAQVASGEIANTQFTLSAADMGLRSSYTAEDLGLDSLGTESLSEEAQAALQSLIPDLSAIVTALLYDCPYDFYWYDKATSGASGMSYRLSYSSSSGNIVSISIPSAIFSFTVAEEYADENGDYYTDSNSVAHPITVDSSKTLAVNTAVENINSIVESNADLSDYQKLSAYKDTIDDMVDYNFEAADDNNNTPYGNPWQLIWVFDDDDSTKVVCEGYSKAFQYLCDLSDFQSSEVESRIVTGTMTGGTGAGGHMWNVVTMNDGENYLVDVTNCDNGSIGYPDKLFLVGNENGNVYSGYTFNISSANVSFIYDSDTLSSYETSELTLNTTSYDPTYEEPHEHDYIFKTINWDEGYASAEMEFECSTCHTTAEVTATVTSEDEDADCTLPSRTTYTAKATFEGKEYTDSTYTEREDMVSYVDPNATVYKLVDFITAGKRYLIVTNNSAGPAHALAYASEGTIISVTDDEVTVIENTINGNPATYIESQDVDDPESMWIAEANGNYWNFKNINGSRTRYLHTNRPTLDASVSVTDWTYQNNALYTTRTSGVYTYVTYNNTWGVQNSESKVYLYEETRDVEINLTKVEVVPALGHDLLHHDAQAATCIEIGWHAYDTCSRCDYTTYVEIPATGHAWGEVTYTWAEDNSSVTATRTCANDAEHVETETATATYSVTTPATCEEAGTGTYTSAAFENSAFAVQSKTVEIPATGHSWKFVDITLTEKEGGGYTAAANYVCENNEEHTLTKDAEVTSSTTDASCTEAGMTVYTAGVAAADSPDGTEHTATKTVTGEALGHDFGEWTVTKEATCTEEGVETRECSRCDATETRTVEALGHALVHHDAQAATCTEEGWDAYDTCSRCDYTTYVEIPAIGHAWGEPVYTWAEDNSSVTATRTCANDAEHVETETVEATSEEILPTCDTAGYTTYTSAAFTNTAFTVQTKIVTGDPATGHSWKFVDITFTEKEGGGYTAAANYVCENNEEHKQTKDAEVTASTTDASCTEAGTTVYTASVAAADSPDGTEHTATKTVTGEALGHALVHHDAQAATCTEVGWGAYDTCSRCDYTTYVEIPATGHAWGEVTYTWAEDNSSVAATRTCANDAEHVETETAAATYTVTTPATCEAAGTGTYTSAAFENTAFAVQSKTVEIPATGHNWDYTNIDWKWMPKEGGGYTATATLICKNDANHTDTLQAEVTGPVDNTYTATVTGPNGKTYSDTKVVEPVGPDFYDERIFGPDRYTTARYVGDRYLKLSGKPFANVVVACGTNFPDALGGGYLAYVKDAPILLVTNYNEGEIATYIKENMDPDGTVYLLGGTGVVSNSFENMIEDNGMTALRLGGADRYETNINILKAAGVTNEEILVCTGTGYADSLSASAAHRPILLVGDNLTTDQKQYLKDIESNKFYLIGGTGAVKASIENNLKNDLGFETDRIFGQTRYETSTAVATKFFPQTEYVILAYAQNFPDGLSGGPLAMQLGAPILLVDSNSTTAAVDYVQSADAKRSISLGGEALISNAARDTIMGR